MTYNIAEEPSLVLEELFRATCTLDGQSVIPFLDPTVRRKATRAWHLKTALSITDDRILRSKHWSNWEPYVALRRHHLAMMNAKEFLRYPAFCMPHVFTITKQGTDSDPLCGSKGISRCACVRKLVKSMSWPISNSTS